MTCVQLLNTFFSDCVLLVISKRVWAYTPATSWYTRQSPQPTGYEPRVAQHDSCEQGGSRSPPEQLGLSRTGLHSRSRNLLLLPSLGASSYSRENQSSTPASLKRESDAVRVPRASKRVLRSSFYYHYYCSLTTCDGDTHRTSSRRRL